MYNLYINILLASEIEKLDRGSEFLFTAVIKSIGDF